MPLGTSKAPKREQDVLYIYIYIIYTCRFEVEVVQDFLTDAGHSNWMQLVWEEPWIYVLNVLISLMCPSGTSATHPKSRMPSPDVYRPAPENRVVPVRNPGRGGLATGGCRHVAASGAGWIPRGGVEEEDRAQGPTSTASTASTVDGLAQKNMIPPLLTQLRRQSIKTLCFKTL